MTDTFHEAKITTCAWKKIYVKVFTDENLGKEDCSASSEHR
jgi:hypothetical protein